MIDRIVVVGSGHAGVQLCESLRGSGYLGGLVLIGDDDVDLPYQRPPLSKEYLTGADAELQPLRSAAFFADQGIELVTGSRAVRIDRDARSVALDNGSVIPYERLVLATGARGRELAVEGARLTGVLGMRTASDARRLRELLASEQRVVVIGGGFIGLEFATAARTRGLDVTVLEGLDRPMARVASEPLSGFVTRSIREAGIDLRLGIQIDRLVGDGEHVTGVVLAGGETIPADFVVVGIGIEPNDGLAAGAGLLTDSGVLVDTALQTSDPNIFAIGDCARYPSVHAGGLARLESVQNANGLARHAAARLLGLIDPDAAYSEVPWFWSHLGPHKITIAGLGRPGDVLVARGDVESSRFSVYHYRDERLVCVESVNSAADHLTARSLIGAGVTPPPPQWRTWVMISDRRS